MQNYQYDKKTYVQPDQRVIILCPYSEVCCHMQVADRLMYAEVKESHYENQTYYSVQLYNKDGSIFSGPITTGEAGLYRDDGGIYYYPPAAGYEFGGS